LRRKPPSQFSPVAAGKAERTFFARAVKFAASGEKRRIATKLTESALAARKTKFSRSLSQQGPQGSGRILRA
jgi:hypothetical protein